MKIVPAGFLSGSHTEGAGVGDEGALLVLKCVLVQPVKLRS